jgi:hypothetical protein
MPALVYGSHMEKTWSAVLTPGNAPDANNENLIPHHGVNFNLQCTAIDGMFGKYVTVVACIHAISTGIDSLIIKKLMDQCLCSYITEIRVPAEYVFSHPELMKGAITALTNEFGPEIMPCLQNMYQILKP